MVSDSVIVFDDEPGAETEHPRNDGSNGLNE
jgi:hypothetical protein